MFNFTLGILLALNTTTIAQSSYQVRNDKTIEAGAAARAAARIGGMRGTIDFDEVPVIVNTSESREPEASNLNTGLAPRPAWAPKDDKEQLPPMVKGEPPEGVDTMATGSIRVTPKSPRKRIQWEIFDANGRIVKRP